MEEDLVDHHDNDGARNAYRVENMMNTITDATHHAQLTARDVTGNMECLDALSDKYLKFYRTPGTTTKCGALRLQRQILIQWCHDRLSDCHLPHFLAEWTVNLSDRFFANLKNVPRLANTWRTMTTVALFLVIKLHLGNASASQPQHQEGLRVARSRSLVMRSLNLSEARMFILEVLLLKVLKFHVYPPLLNEHLEEMIPRILQVPATSAKIPNATTESEQTTTTLRCLLQTRSKEHAIASVYEMFDTDKTTQRDIALACLVNALEDLSLSMKTTTTTKTIASLTSMALRNLDTIIRLTSNNNSIRSLQERIRAMYDMVYGHHDCNRDNLFPRNVRVQQAYDLLISNLPSIVEDDVDNNMDDEEDDNTSSTGMMTHHFNSHWKNTIYFSPATLDNFSY